MWKWVAQPGPATGGGGIERKALSGGRWCASLGLLQLLLLLDRPAVPAAAAVTTKPAQGAEGGRREARGVPKRKRKEQSTKRLAKGKRKKSRGKNCEKNILKVGRGGTERGPSLTGRQGIFLVCLADTV